MTGVPPIDRAENHAQAPRARRRAWFSRPEAHAPSPDQEDEVRARLYARPVGPERTVTRVARAEQIAERPAA